MSRTAIYDYIIHEKLCEYILRCNTATKFHKFKEALLSIVSAMHEYDTQSQYNYIATFVKNLEMSAARNAAEDKAGNANISNLSRYLILGALLHSGFREKLEIFLQIKLL